MRAWADGDLLIFVCCVVVPLHLEMRGSIAICICVVICPSIFKLFVRSYTNILPPIPHAPTPELTTKMVEAARAKGAEVRSIDALQQPYQYGHAPDSSDSSKSSNTHAR